MSLITRPAELALKVEATEGTAETLAAADVTAKVVELDGGADPQAVERAFKTAFLGTEAHQIGVVPGTIDFKIEATGGGDTTTVPACDRHLQALGHQRRVVNVCDLTGAPTGTFRPGEAITVSGTEVARFVEMEDGTSPIYVETGATLTGSESLVGALSGATATVHATPAVTARGWAFSPISSGGGAYTAKAWLGKDQGNSKAKVVECVGCRGDGTLEVDDVANLLHLVGTLQGAGQADVDLAFLASTTPLDIVPQAFKANQVDINGVTTGVCVNRFSLAFGNQVENRLCSGSTSGVFSAYIVDRAPILTIDPEQTQETVVAWNSLLHNATAFGIYIPLGTSAGKRFRLCAAKAQFTNLPKGDRNGLAIYDASVALRKQTGDDEYFLVFI